MTALRSYAPLTIDSLPATHGCKPGSWMDRARSASKTCPACGSAFRPRISKTAAGSWLAEHEGYWTKRRCCSQSCAKRLKNPMHRAASRERMATTLRSTGHRPSVMGGNGRGMTEPQRLLLQKLGGGWIAELTVSTGVRPGNGIPGHWKIDIANPELMIAVEVDGSSHASTKVRERDARKDEFLASKGWSVFRVSNARAVELSTTSKSADTLLTSLMAS
ncbi:endonuclease domain-containing protein [Xanthobacter sp. TB0136]|uniref:endonuclease domain-containing protein n=1 Tax=Xanthobacter sp. TB0136 TaxID=3459177 RepID=UPI00403A2F9A